MASKDKTNGDGDSKNSICTKLCVLKHYAPIAGAASYSLLSVNVLNPTFNLGFLPKKDVTNILLTGSILGTGYYLYSRPHLAIAPKQNRILYAGFGSVAFTFSSILLWAILRSLLPNNVLIGSVAGLGSCYVLAKTGQNYLALVDSQIAKK